MALRFPKFRPSLNQLSFFGLFEAKQEEPPANKLAQTDINAGEPAQGEQRRWI